MRIKERCIYCDGEIFYTGENPLVKCNLCGATFAITQFQSEAAKLREKLAEGERARAAVEQAQREKKAAQKALWDAVSALGSIQSSQAETEARLNAICETMETDAQTRTAMAELLSVLRSRQADDHDVLTRLLENAMSGQDATMEALSTLRKISQLLLDGQNDILARMQGQTEIAGLIQGLGMDVKKRDALLMDIYNWSQTVNQENTARLERAVKSSDALLHGQREMDNKLNRLEAELTETQAELKAFHGQWEAKQLQKLEQLYQQASGYQRDCEFEKADALYARLLTEGGEDVEVNWRRVLCHYGVTYQMDEIKAKRVPTLLQPDLTLPEDLSVRRAFAASLDKADDAQREYYQGALEEIDGILTQYREIRNEVSYDVFISVKQERDGRMTREANVASDLYDKIREWGLTVFNSRRSHIPSKWDYEPYIIASLLSAKALIVVGSCRENMESQWVRNEWTRYQWLQKHDLGTERTMFCYLTDGMSPKDIPLGLNPGRQAIVDGIAAHDKVRANLEHLFMKKDMTHRPGGEDDSAKFDEAQFIEYMRVLKKLGLLDAIKGELHTSTITNAPEEQAESAETTSKAAEPSIEPAEMAGTPASQADEEGVTGTHVDDVAKAIQDSTADAELSPQTVVEDISDDETEGDQEEDTATDEEQSIEDDDTVSDEDTNEEADEKPHDTDNSFRFRDHWYGGIEITGYCGNAEVLNIPSTICGKTVVSIGDEAFSSQKSLRRITIPEGVHRIGSDAFRNCDNLETISIPESVSDIYSCAFSGCVKLAEISLPSGIYTISPHSFTLCRSLRHLRIPRRVHEIDWHAFQCSGIVSIDIPEQVSKIGEGAFFCCEELESITIPSHVTVIDSFTFIGCSRLKSVAIPLGVTEIRSLAFSNCKLLESVEIPNSVTKIGDGAFQGCKNLKSVSIPDSVTELGEEAFKDCESMKSVTISRSIESIRDRTFENCKSLESVSVPNGVLSLGYNVFLNCGRLKRVYIPDSIEVISDEFLGCDESLLIVGESSQKVQWWCINHNIAYDSPTVQKRKAAGRCEYCGHRFNPFTKKCMFCSMPKSY